jgi:hypothetical protein
MPDTKITDLTIGTTVVPADWLVYVDVSDTSMASTGTDKKLSPAVLVAGLPSFVASGASHAPGIVPDPGAAAGATKFLREDATWVVPAGGGGSPGGTANQVQWNSAGAFGGFTVGGDATLNTSTGALTVTKTNNVVFAPSATTDTTNAANITSGILPVARLQPFVASGASHAPGIVPDPGASAGTTRYLREDATWFVPPGGGSGTPGGTANQIQWNSAGAFAGFTLGGDATLVTSTGVMTIAAGAITYPKIQNVAASSLLGNPTGSAAAPSEITLGSNLAFVGTTLRGRVPMWAGSGPGTAIANTVTPSSIFAGVPTALGSLTIPANTLRVGQRIVLGLYGIYGCATPTVTVQVKLGSTVILQGTTPALTTTPSNNWHFDFVYQNAIDIQAIGAGGKAIGMARINFASGGTFPLVAAGNGLVPSQVTIDTTTSLLLDILITWSVAAVGNTMNYLGGAVYLDG